MFPFRLLRMIVPLCAGLATSAPAQQVMDLSAGQRLTSDFQQERFDILWHQMDAEMRRIIGSEDKLASFHAIVNAEFGKEKQVRSEQAIRHLGHYLYWRVADYERGAAPLITQWAIDRDGRIAGFSIRPYPPPAFSRFSDYKNKSRLRLPFNGDWYVAWGGRTTENNHHAAHISQRFAYDFLIERDGKTHEGDGSRPDDYYCWGQPILAAASGRVAFAIDGLPDNPIGTRDERNPGGNHIVLDLGKGEYAFFAHLRQGSVSVRPGDKVKAGQEIGLCGNSGNSSEPHLHFHMQTTPVLNEGEGLPARFRSYHADGRPVRRGEPVRGQTITHALQ